MKQDLRHLTDIASLSDSALNALHDRIAEIAANPGQFAGALKGHSLINLFYEDSTRTRVSFETAATRLGMNVINVSARGSSVAKGEGLVDTFHTLEAMGPDVIVLRHPEDGAPERLAQASRGASVVNAGDGCRAHPTQALLDAATMLAHRDSLSDLTVTIAGDIAHSRVARSNHALLTRVGVGELRIAAPESLLPQQGFEGAMQFSDLDSAVAGSDVVMMLRIQRERMAGIAQPDGDDWHREWGLTQARLEMASKGALVMHPGPMNRGVEIASEVADGPQSVILDQVRMGVFVRMAVLAEIVGG